MVQMNENDIRTLHELIISKSKPMILIAGDRAYRIAIPDHHFEINSLKGVTRVDFNAEIIDRVTHMDMKRLMLEGVNTTASELIGSLATGYIYNTGLLDEPEIKDVIFNDPATIVFWTDGTKTVVKAQNETFDPEKGLAMAVTKKFFGNKGNYCNHIKKWLPKDDN